MMSDTLHKPMPTGNPPNRVALRRLERGLSQGQVAAEMRITPGTYSRIENGRTWPSPAQVRTIAQVLDWDFGHLMVVMAEIWEESASARTEPAQEVA